MYFPPIEEIRFLRTRLKLSQKELARHAGVSQSIIAKIEKGKVSPSYETVVKIFSALDHLIKHNQLRAKDVMNRKVVTCKEDSLVKQALTKMVKHAFSQMPVVSKDNRVSGYISEEIILRKLSQINNDTKVKEVMEGPMPMLNRETEISIIYKLLEQYPMVAIISESGKLEGIITKTDILKKDILGNQKY